jgi:hypothetical protein
MTPATSRPSLQWLFVRVWRIKIARYAMKAGRGLLTVAELILPKDLRR